jgi:hypothetical protein
VNKIGGITFICNKYGMDQRNYVSKFVNIDDPFSELFWYTRIKGVNIHNSYLVVMCACKNRRFSKRFAFMILVMFLIWGLVRFIFKKFLYEIFIFRFGILLYYYPDWPVFLKVNLIKLQAISCWLSIQYL